MKKKYVVSIVLLLILSSLSLVAWNALKSKRNFVVLFNDDLGFCFLLDEGYHYDIKPLEFTYGGGKNSGHFVLSKSKISNSINRIEINGFKGGYQKLVNKRVYEYQLDMGYKLRDEFVNAQDMPVNLVPYKESCSKIKQRFKKHIEIFKGALK